ncbi:hypothetical protein JHK85_028320 [Glycine max]|nr:hypothetical protein JHK85_028320 [Glycine max]KAG5003654.1 hypothetical protein JHK86_027793 [Glycine max]
MDATEAAYDAIVNEVLNNLTKNVAKKSIVEKLDEVIPSSQLEPAFNFTGTGLGVYEKKRAPCEEHFSHHKHYITNSNGGDEA